MIARSKFQQIAKKPSDLTTPIPSNQPTGYVSTVTSHSLASKSSTEEIGTVCYNDKTQEYRYKCDREGCTKKSMGRAQDLKRHFDHFHGSMILVCPVEECKYTTARRDKLKTHRREAHGSEFKF
jgi:hypothetical protein